jgi:hypothetical protein
MQIEFFIMLTDNTWSTATFDVPLDRYDREAAVQWLEDQPRDDIDQETVAGVQVYHYIDPEQEGT